MLMHSCHFDLFNEIKSTCGHVLLKASAWVSCVDRCRLAEVSHFFSCTSLARSHDICILNLLIGSEIFFFPFIHAMFPVTPPQSTISPAPRCSFHQCNSFPLSFSEYICIDIYRSIYVSPVNMTKELSFLFSIQVWPIQMLLCMLQMLSFYSRTSDNVSVFNGLHIGHNNPPWNFFKKLKLKLFPLTEGGEKKIVSCFLKD